MASDRQLALAANLAAGMDGYEAVLAAGWPPETAVWLGPAAHEYLAKAGVEIPRGRATPPTTAAPTLQSEPPAVVAARAEDEQTTDEPIPAVRSRGRPKKEVSA